MERTFNCQVVATQFVASLGNDWEVVNCPPHGDHYSAIRNKETGVEFSLSGQHHDNKIHIAPRMIEAWRQKCGMWPQVDNRPTIKMGPEKSTEKKVEDFKRRILEEGTKWFLAAEAWVARHISAEARRVDSRKKFADLLNIQWSDRMKDSEIKAHINGVSVSADPIGDKTSLTLSYLDAAQVAKVMEILKG